MLDRVITVVLAGGVGTRLHPLTADRAKPAVPFGGKYRIIDFTLSNCLHSGLRRVLVLTQYKSHSLQKHLRDAWSVFNPSIGEYITPIPPQMRTGDSWYCGTADAVYQNLYLLDRSDADNVMILSGDHIYRMDYAAMVAYHERSGADATIACMKVPLSQASQFGVMAIDSSHRIIGFQEKPLSPSPLPDDPDHALVSMGIYVFRRDVLGRLLRADHEKAQSSHDFGNDVIPRLVRHGVVRGYVFGGSEGRVTSDKYWRDVGTIDAFYDANLDLLKADAPVDLHQRDWPIRTVEGQAPPARTVPGRSGVEATLQNSLLSSGTVIAGGRVVHSILFRNVRVSERATVEDCILMDDVRVGEGTRLRRCIVDKGVDIPAGIRIGFDREADGKAFTVSDGGVVVVPKEHVFRRVQRKCRSTATASRHTATV